MIRCCAAARIDMPIDAYVFPYDVLYNGILFGKASYSERFDAHLNEMEAL